MLRYYTDVILKRKQVICRGPASPVLRFYLNFPEYEMSIERELCLYFTAFLNNRQQLATG